MCFFLNWSHHQPLSELDQYLQLKPPIINKPCSSNITGSEFYLDETDDSQPVPRLLRSRQQIKAPERLIECCTAENLENASDWKHTMDDELMYVRENETWYLTDLPEGRENQFQISGFIW